MFTILFLIFLAACFAAGATGALFPPGPWYDRLHKPRWTPPNWLFPVAWTTLYLAMSYAAALVALSENNGLGLALWGLQIALNTLWTPVFFGLRRLKQGLYVLVALWVSVAATMVVFFNVAPLAGWLFMPYLAWVSVAGARNYAVWKLNPDAESLDAQSLD